MLLVRAKKYDSVQKQRTGHLKEIRKASLSRVFAVQANLFLALIVIFVVAKFNPAGPWTWLVWYVFASNSLLNISLFKNTDIFSPQHIFPAFYCLAFTTGDLVYQLPGLLTAGPKTQLMIVAGLPLFLIGSSYRGTLNKVQVNRLRGKLRIIPGPYVKGTFALMGLCFIALIAYSAQARFPIFASNVESYRFEVQSTVKYYTPIYYLSLSATVTFLWAMLGFTKFKTVETKITLLFVALASLSTLVLWGTRGRIVDAILIFLVAYHYQHRKIKGTAFALLSAAGLAILAFIGILRRQTATTYDTSLVDRMLHEVQINVNNLETIVSIIPEAIDYSYGKSLLYPFYTLLPGKQESIGFLLRNILELDFEGGGISPTILGGFYMDFGVVGALLGMLIFGLILGEVYRRLNRNKYWLAIYPIVLVGSLEIVRNGGIINFLLAFYIVLVLLLCRFTIRSADTKSLEPRVRTHRVTVYSQNRG